jgi:DNA-binding transcriptional MerR regulator
MSALAPHQLLSIGDALDLLLPDFPDLTISKLRYLESEGLVEPQRTTSGYRKYSYADVQRLRFVLTAQREQYLPLRVIREQLDALDRGLEPTGSGKAAAPRSLVAVESLPAAGDFRPNAPLKLTRQELLEAAKASEEVLSSCEQFGLIEDGKSHFSGDDVAVVTSVVGLSTYGIEARHLRQFKIAADRELGLVEQVVKPIAKQRDAESAGQAEDVARDIAALAASLHMALVRAGLHDITGQH